MAQASGALSAAPNAFLSLGLTYGVGNRSLRPSAPRCGSLRHRFLTHRRSPFALTGFALLLLFLAEDSLFSGSVQVALSLAVFSLPSAQGRRPVRGPAGPNRRIGLHEPL